MSILNRSAVAATLDVDRFARLAARAAAAPSAVLVLEGGPTGPRVGRYDAADPAGRPVPLASAIGVGLCARIAREGTVCTDATHVAGGTGVAGADVDHGAGAYLGLPVVTETGVVGALCVLDAAPRAWTHAEVDDLAALAELIGHRVGAVEDAGRTELEQQNAFLNAVLENLSEGVAACDAEGTLVYFNPRLRAIHGLPERRIAREEWARAYDLYDADGERLLASDEIPLARAYQGERVRRQHLVVRNENGARHFVSSGDPLVGANGERLGAVVLMQDITAEQRRRRVRAEHLAVATELAQASDHATGVAVALTHLRSALGATTADLVGVRDVVDPDIDRRVVGEAVRDGVTVQRPLDEPFAGSVVCAPVTVGTRTTAALYLAGPSADLLDDLSASTVEGVAALLGQWLERRRATQLHDDLALARHDLRRLGRLTTAFVWSVEMLPSGFSALRVASSPRHVLGGDPPAPGEWLSWVQERTDPADLDALQQWNDRLLSGRPGEVTTRLRGADGTVRWIRTTCRVRSDGDRRHLDGVSEIVDPPDGQPGVSR